MTTIGSALTYINSSALYDTNLLKVSQVIPVSGFQGQEGPMGVKGDKGGQGQRGRAGQPGEKVSNLCVIVWRVPLVLWITKYAARFHLFYFSQGDKGQKGLKGEKGFIGPKGSKVHHCFTYEQEFACRRLVYSATYKPSV